MYCKHCGKEVSDDARFCAACGKSLVDSPVTEQVEEPKKKKKRHPILGAIVFVFGMFVIIGALGGNAEPTKVSSPTSSVSAPAETTAAKPFTVGDTLELNNILVTLEDVSEISGGQLLKPSEGNVFVTCEFTIENKKSSDLSVSSILCFHAYFDDYASNLSLGAMTADGSKPQLDGSVAAGKKINGVVGFEAPADWSTMEIHYSPYATGSDTFVFEYSK